MFQVIVAKEDAVPQNDNVPTAINVVNQEPPASTTTTSITTATTSEVATPKTKLNTPQWVKIFKIRGQIMYKAILR